MKFLAHAQTFDRGGTPGGRQSFAQRYFMGAKDCFVRVPNLGIVYIEQTVSTKTNRMAINRLKDHIGGKKKTLN